MRIHGTTTLLAIAALALALFAGRPAAAQSVSVNGFALENGDTNGDGDRDLSDPVHLLRHLFLGGPEPVPLAPCTGAPEPPLNGDSDRSGERDLSDAVHLLAWLFTAGPAPADACWGVFDLPMGGGDDRRRQRVLPVSARPFGQSYEEWAIEWWRWVFGIPADRNPLTTSTCTLPQEGKVWFIAASFGAGTVACEVPVGKAIFFPLSGFLNDFPCPDPNFKPAPGQSLEDFLIETVQPFVAMIQSLELFIDGVSAGDAFRQRVTSHLFTFTGDLSLLPLDPCITGTEQFGIADGYWVMVVGLGLGEHSLRVKINFAGTEFEVNNLVTIVE